MPRISRSLDGTANSFRNSPRVEREQPLRAFSCKTAARRGQYHPTSESRERFVAFCERYQMMARNAQKSNASLVRIGQGRYRILGLDARKCLSCMGAEPPGSDVSCSRVAGARPGVRACDVVAFVTRAIALGCRAGREWPTRWETEPRTPRSRRGRSPGRTPTMALRLRSVP